MCLKIEWMNANEWMSPLDFEEIRENVSFSRRNLWFRYISCSGSSPSKLIVYNTHTCAWDTHLCLRYTK